LYGRAVLTLNSYTPFSGRPHLISSGTYDVRGIRVELYDMVAEVQFLEAIFIIFLDGVATEKVSTVSPVQYANGV
jgi:hypothetical protein